MSVWATPQNATRSVDYAYTPDKLNRSSMNDNGDVTNYSPNALNQYTNVAGGSCSYDANFNLTGTGGSAYIIMRPIRFSQPSAVMTMPSSFMTDWPHRQADH